MLANNIIVTNRYTSILSINFFIKLVIILRYFYITYTNFNAFLKGITYYGYILYF